MLIHLHSQATTTPKVRTAIQASTKPASALAALRLAFAYNQRNRPVSLTRTGGGSTQTSNYLFNALEQMVQRRTTAPGGPAGTVQYIYGLDGELLAEADAATGRTLRDYIWLPQGDISPAADNDNEEGASSLPLPLALVTGVNTGTPALLAVHADHLNRPTRLTDATRATVWSASYDPFGQPVSIAGPVEQNLRFPGQYFLIESGLSYNWHRFYDPTMGRYTQPDPLRFVDGPSVYGYAGQSPLMWVDPTGEFSFVPILLGAGIGALTDIGLQLLLNGGNSKCIDWGEVGVSAGLGAIGGAAATGWGVGRLSFGRKLDFLFNKGIDQTNSYNAARAAGNANRIGIADTAANRAQVEKLFNRAYRDPSSIVGPGKVPGSNIREFFLPGVTGTGSKVQFVERGGQVITIIVK